MPRIHGVRERLHQPFWDTLIRATGAPVTPLGQQSKLFGNANVGQLDRTNMQTAGVLASDQTYVVLALRCYMFFDGTDARTLYQQVSSQLYFTFTLGNKPVFQAPAWYHPAGGGIFGSGATAADAVIYNNGWPSQDAILKLARPIVIPVRQNISVDASFFPVGLTNILTLMNAPAPDDQQVVMYMIDGLQTRDVQ